MRSRHRGLTQDANTSVASWFETALARLLTMRGSRSFAAAHSTIFPRHQPRPE